MNLTPLTLDPALDPWERQPRETAARYGQFTAYRDLGRVRTVREASEGLARAAGHLRAVAAAFRWRERAEAWDHHRDRIDAAAWAEGRRAAARADAALLDAAASKLAARVTELDAADLTPGELTRMLDVTLRHRRLLYGDPMGTMALTGPGGGPMAVKVTEFAALSPEARRSRLLELAAMVQRRARALDPEDDGDDDGQAHDVDQDHDDAQGERAGAHTTEGTNR